MIIKGYEIGKGLGAEGGREGRGGPGGAGGRGGDILDLFLGQAPKQAQILIQDEGMAQTAHKAETDVKEEEAEMEALESSKFM